MPPYAPTFSIDDFNDDENLAVLRRCQRRIVELEAQIAADKGTKKPVHRLKTFANLGRCIAKVVDTFGSLDSLIAENDRRIDLENKRTMGEEVHDEEEAPTPEQERAYNGFKELMRFVPALRKPLFEAEADELNEILNALRNGARNARSDDTKKIKTAIVPWLQKLFPEMEALDSESRDERGIYHDYIGGLLCPIEYAWADLEVRKMIRDGDPDYQVTAESWWTGLYPHKKFDPEHPDVGLFMNVMLLMVWKFIFTSPVSVKHAPPHEEPEKENVASTSTALPSRLTRKTQKKAGPTPKRSVAAIIGLNRVTGRSIAYAAVQYRVALSDAHHWEERDGAFDYIQFYNNVVDYFESPPGPLAKMEIARLLDWWNTYALGLPINYSLYEGGDLPGDSSVGRIKAIRSAREAGMNIVPSLE